jgi:hypothetical protein
MVKLPTHRVELPGDVISFYIVPLDPAYAALAGRGTFRPIYLNLRLLAYLHDRRKYFS